MPSSRAKGSWSGTWTRASPPGTTPRVTSSWTSKKPTASRSSTRKGTSATPAIRSLGTTVNRRFGLRSNPNSRLYNGEPSLLVLDAITLGADASVSCATLPSSVAITKDSLRTGRMGSDYADTLTASYTAGPRSWSYVVGEMPPGLFLDPATGVVSGVPTRTGRFGIAVRLEVDAVEARRDYTVEVTAPTLTLEGVLAELMGTSHPLTPDEIRYLDLLGNHNGRLDVGDFAAWLDAAGRLHETRMARRQP